MEPSISVVVTNYNTTDLTIRCIAGVARFKGSRSLQTIVVDDASAEPLRGRLPPWVDLVENVTNQGYVRSVNIGVARARGDVVLLLDSDAEPLCDVFGPIARAFAARPRLGAVGFHLVDQNDRTTGSMQPEPTALGLAMGQQLEEKMFRWAPGLFGPAQAYTIHSCAIAFRRTAFEELRGFDEQFDFLDADTDFSMRLRRAGWELDVDSEIKILHEGSGSPQSTAKRVVRFHANRWRLLEKHGRLRHPTVMKGVLATRHLAELVLVGGFWWLSGRDSALRADKLSGRKQLLATIWNSYRAV